MTIRPAELIEAKRNGQEHSAADLAGLILAYARDEVPDYQMAAWCMAVYFRGLTGNLTGLLNFGSLSPSGYASWQPSSRVLSTLALPLLTSTAQVQLTSQAKSGSWQVDDVYLDPRIAKLG